jgi:hypothetical protein
MAAAALGFADHSGWAIAVAIVADGGWLRVVARERIATIGPALPRQPFHAVAEQGAPRDVIEAARESALACSAEAIGELAAALLAAGHDTIAAGVPAGTMAIPPDIERILASHSLLHAAEGEMFRESLAEGASMAGIARVLRMPRKEALALAAAESGLALDLFTARLTKLREDVGAPWTADHKLATAAAWLALRQAAPGRRQATSW